MSKKAKATVRLGTGEAYVVASKEMWDHIIATYESLASEMEDPEDKAAWMNLAAHISHWANDTVYYEDQAEDDGWN